MSAPKPTPYDPAYVSEISLDSAARALAAGRTTEAERLVRATHRLHLALKSRPDWEWRVERRLGALETRLEGGMTRLDARIDALTRKK